MLRDPSLLLKPEFITYGFDHPHLSLKINFADNYTAHDLGLTNYTMSIKKMAAKFIQVQYDFV